MLYYRTGIKNKSESFFFFFTITNIYFHGDKKQTMKTNLVLINNPVNTLASKILQLSLTFLMPYIWNARLLYFFKCQLLHCLHCSAVYNVKLNKTFKMKSILCHRFSPPLLLQFLCLLTCWSAVSRLNGRSFALADLMTSCSLHTPPL